MNVVDSSAWLEYFADGPNAGEFTAAIEDADSLIVPTISLFEVFKRIRVQRDADLALEAIAFMQRGRPIDLDADLAIEAADLSVDLKLPLADSIVLATARRHEAMLWTQDSLRGHTGHPVPSAARQTTLVNRNCDPARLVEPSWWERIRQ